MQRFMLCTAAGLLMLSVTFPCPAQPTTAPAKDKPAASPPAPGGASTGVAQPAVPRETNAVPPSKPGLSPDAPDQLHQETKTASPESLTGIYDSAKQVVEAFNAGKAKEVSEQFLPEGEWVDELGTVYQGRSAIEGVLTKYFEKYPGAQIGLEIESVQVIGPVAIEEGIRTMTVAEDSQAVIQYVAILAKTDSGWKYASVKDTAREMLMTAHAALEPLGWLVGEWVNEGTEARVKINYQWSEDENFLLGDYVVETNGEVVMKSTHRIGWDPLHGQIRSWLFDSDGGIGEGIWTPLGDSWHIHSSAILPDGRTGSAIITWSPHNDFNRFSMKGTDRLIGGEQDDDFELDVVRRPPTAGRAEAAPPLKP